MVRKNVFNVHAYFTHLLPMLCPGKKYEIKKKEVNPIQIYFRMLNLKCVFLVT